MQITIVQQWSLPKTQAWYYFYLNYKTAGLDFLYKVIYKSTSALCFAAESSLYLHVTVSNILSVHKEVILSKLLHDPSASLDVSMKDLNWFPINFRRLNFINVVLGKRGDGNTVKVKRNSTIQSLNQKPQERKIALFHIL